MDTRNRRGVISRWELIGVATAVALALGMGAQRANSAEQNPASPVAQAAKVLELTGCPKPLQKAHKRRKVVARSFIVPPPCIVTPPAPFVPEPELAPLPTVVPYYVPGAPEPVVQPPEPLAQSLGFADYYGSSVGFMGPASFVGGSFASGAVSVVVNNAATAKATAAVYNSYSYDQRSYHDSHNVTTYDSHNVTTYDSHNVSSVVNNSTVIYKKAPYAHGVDTHKAPEIDAGNASAMGTLLFGLLAVFRGGRATKPDYPGIG